MRLFFLVTVYCISMESFGEAMGAKPKKVQEKIYAGDPEALSAMGKAGNRAKQEKKNEAAHIEEMLDILRTKDATRTRRQANEHIVPLDTYDA